jgi:hypothetical protein
LSIQPDGPQREARLYSRMRRCSAFTSNWARRSRAPRSVRRATPDRELAEPPGPASRLPLVARSACECRLGRAARLHRGFCRGRPGWLRPSPLMAPNARSAGDRIRSACPGRSGGRSLSACAPADSTRWSTGISQGNHSQCRAPARRGEPRSGSREGPRHGSPRQAGTIAGEKLLSTVFDTIAGRLTPEEMTMSCRLILGLAAATLLGIMPAPVDARAHYRAHIPAGAKVCGPADFRGQSPFSRDPAQAGYRGPHYGCDCYRAANGRAICPSWT